MAKINYLSTEIRVNVNSQEAVDGLQQMYKGMEKIRAAIKEIEAEGITPDNRDRYNQLVSDLNKMEAATKKLSRETLDLGKIFDDLSGQSLATLQKALKKVKESMKNLDPKKLAEQGKDYREEMTRMQVQARHLENQINELTGANDRLSRATRGSADETKKQGSIFSQTVQRLASYVAIYSGFNFIKGQVADTVKENIALSDSLADIRKVTGMSADEVNELSKALHGLDTRTTSEGLHELAYEAGKIGLKGVDDVMQFVKAGNQIKVALGEDLGENALVELMKMSEVMGTTKTMGVEKSLLAIGSSINELSASSTASGEDINGFAKRLSGVAAQANITTDQLLGLGSASSAMNMEVEVAATAFNKFINQIVAKTDVVAKAAGIEFEVLDEMIKSGETMEATVLVLEKLGQKGGLRALGPIMGDLGSNGSRLNNVLATFSQNVDLLKTHLNTSSTAFEQATSVTNEYNIKNENAAAIVARMGNAIKETFVNSGITEWIEGILRKLYDLPKTIEENKFTIVAAITAITIALTGLETRIKGITKIGILRLLASFRMGIASIAKVLAANPWTAAAAAIGIFTATVVDAVKKVDFLGAAMKRLNRYKDEDEEVTIKETARLKQYFDWLERTKKGTVEYQAAKDAIMKNYGSYLESLNIEIDKLEDLETAYKNVEKAVLAAAKAKVAEKAITGAEEAYASAAADQYSKLRKSLVGQGGRSTEEIDNIILRIRNVIDEGKEMPAELQAIIDSFSYSMAMPGSLANPFGSSSTVNPFQDNINLIKAARKAYDEEIKGIESAYGLSIGEILAGGEIGKKTVPPLGGGGEDKDSEKLAAAKKEQQAVLAALELFYAQQEQVINQQYLDREITVTEREKRLADVEKRMLQSRIAARRALLNDPDAIEEWSAELQRMSDENIASSDENAAALTALYGKNLHQIGEDLRNFGEGEMDGIRKNMEQDRIAIQTNAVQMRQELEQILLENDFTGKVTEQYIRSWEKLGFSMSQYKDEAEAFMRDMNTKVYPKLFDIDINTDEGLNTFKDLLLETEGYSVELVNLGAEQMRLLYYQAIQYGDDMADATRRARKFGQRVADERWRQSGGLAREQKLEGRGEAIKDSTSLFSRVGLASENVANDMEIQMYTERMNAAMEYRDLVIQSGGDIEKANEKVQESIANLSEALVEKTMTQLETLKTFMDPLEDLGEELGAAFALDDATEQTEAFREAMWGAAEDVADATKEMITNWVKQKIQHAINKKAIEAQEALSQSTTTTIVQTGEQAKAMAVQQSETEISTTKATKAAENITTEATETSTSGALNIAKGSAKTIGELGWWGIPLVAVISALIGGLISWAMGKVKGAGKAATDTAPAATGKVVSGMLAYDEGNVQSVLASDGHTYAARVGGIGSGSGIVSVPTLTNVGGQAALVGEQGPEVVIGRATTRAMMQNNPRLLQSLIAFDRLHSGRGFRAYDSGNVQELGMGGNGDNGAGASNKELVAAITELNRQLKGGIHANVVRKELVSNVVDGMYEEKTRGGNKNLTRLLGG